MGRRTESGRTPVLSAFCVILPLIGIALFAISFAAGTHPKILPQLYYYEVDTTHMSLPSAASPGGRAGSPRTTAAPGLAPAYAVYLLGSCTRGNPTDSCTPPQLGYTFDPRTELGLNSTVLPDPYSAAFESEMSEYHRLSPFVAGAHVAAFAILLISSMVACAGGRRPGVALAAVLVSWVGTVLSVAAAVAEVVGPVRFVNAFNDEFAKTGLRARLGQLFVLSLVAAGLSVAASVAMSVRHRCAVRHRRSAARRSDALSVGLLQEKGSGTPPKSPLRPLTLLQRMPTWKQHRYDYEPVTPGRRTSQYRGGGRRRHDATAEDRVVLMMDPAGDEVMGEEPEETAGRTQPLHKRHSSSVSGLMGARTGRDYGGGEASYDPYTEQSPPGSA